jgi:hypothetical protein
MTTIRLTLAERGEYPGYNGSTRQNRELPNKQLLLARVI